MKARAVRFGVFVLLVLGSLALDPDQPMNDDMRFYVPAAASYATWLTGGPAVWNRQAIDRAFTANHEHPPVAKYVMGLGWLAFYKWTGLTSDVTACRLPIVMLWAWTVMLLFAWVRREASQLAALACCGCFILLPRLLFDSHAETLDFAVTAFLVAAAESLRRAIATPQWRPLMRTVLMHALALGSKLNAPFAIAAECLDWLFAERPKRRGLDIIVAPIPLALVLVVTAAPLLTLLMWPWVWFDTTARLDAYFNFHLHHYGILFYFGGTLYNQDPAPWFAPLTMLSITTPVVTLVLVLMGLWAAPASPLKRFASLQVLAQLVAVSLPATAKYGGVKLYLPVFPYLCILAGIGFDKAANELAKPWMQRALLAMCLVPALIGVVAYRGYWLSYYNEIVGGVRGATRAGFERQYYDLAYPALREALDRAGARNVAVLPNPKEYIAYFDRWGLKLVQPQMADVIVITHERRWPTYPELEARYRTLPRIETISIGGVPLATLYDAR